MSTDVKSSPAPRAGRSAQSAGARRAYLPGLDGIRAFAVVAVCLFHFEVTHTQGGFLGVDVFFVLSGYLISTQLWTKWVDSPVRLWPFWEARIRRLFPPVLATMVAVCIAMMILDPHGVRALLGDLTAAATYTSNWWYVVDSRSYAVQWGLDRPPVLQHLWSLAVEEQFYLVWPLVVWFGIKVSRRRSKAYRILGVISAVLAVAVCIRMGVGSWQAGVPDPGNAAADPMRFYYGTDSHSMGLLLGATLAFARRGAGFGVSGGGFALPKLAHATILSDLAGLASLGVLVWAVGWANYSDVWLYRYGFAALALCTLVLVWSATREGLVQKLLSLRVLRYLGTRSYGIYLWHWPVVCFTRPEHDLPFSPGVVLAIRVVLTLVISELCYRFVETPIRRNGWIATWKSLRMRRMLVPVLTSLMLVFGSAGAVGYFVEPLTIQDRLHQDVDDKDFDTNVELPSAAPKPSGKASAPGASATPGAPTTPSATPIATNTKELDVIAYGDSFIIGAAPGLEKVFGSVQVRGRVGEQASELLPSLRKDLANGRIPKSSVVIIHTGNNGVVSESDFKATLKALSGVKRVIVALPITPRPWTAEARAMIAGVVGTPDAPKLPNVRVADWAGATGGEKKYFVDGVHPTGKGIALYAKIVQVAAVQP